MCPLSTDNIVKALACKHFNYIRRNTRDQIIPQKRYKQCGEFGFVQTSFEEKHNCLISELPFVYTWSHKGKKSEKGQASILLIDFRR